MMRPDKRDMEVMEDIAASTKVSWREALVVFLLAGAASIAWSLHRGLDQNYDLMNYHLSSVYFWLRGNPDDAIGISSMASWFNPAVYMPVYLLVKYSTPLTQMLVLPVFSAIDLLLVYVLARKLWPAGITQRILAAALCTVLASTGPMFLTEVGTSFMDSATGMLVLAGLILIISNLSASPSRLRLGCLGGGVAFGCATGFKLTNMPYATGMLIAIAVVCLICRGRWARLIFYALGFLFGFVITSGYWCYRLFLLYENPFFPYFNSIFKSPFFPPINWRDTRFFPKSVSDAIAYPFQWFVGQYPTCEHQFRDPRFALLALLLLLVVAVSIAAFINGQRSAGSNQRPESVVRRDRFILFSIFFFVSYGLWLTIFGIQRYAAVLELAGACLLLIWLDRVFRGWTPAVMVALAMSTAFAAGWTRPPDFGHLPRNTQHWFNLSVPEELKHSARLYVVVGGAPLAYVAAFLPEACKFVSVNGGFQLTPKEALGLQGFQQIQSYHGTLTSLSGGALTAKDIACLQSYGLAVDTNAPLIIPYAYGKLHACRLTKITMPTD